jgi:hypothetical protein
LNREDTGEGSLYADPTPARKNVRAGVKIASQSP